MRTPFSRFPALDDAIREAAGAIPLHYIKSTPGRRWCNFGDVLSCVVVAALSGLPVVHRSMRSMLTRLVAIGTIGHGQQGGSPHFWGTCFSPNRGPRGPEGQFIADPDTNYVVHALRGPYSRAICERAGIAAPAVYGEPGWFLPRILPDNVEKTHELGVIMHISQVEMDSVARPRQPWARYAGGEADGVRLISTWHKPSFAAFKDKLREILSCRRIVSNSFHGLVIADAYGLPCACFSPRFNGPCLIDIESGYAQLDHRMADFYLGAGARTLRIYGQPYDEPTDWAQVIRMLDRLWEPLDWDGRDLYDAFPITPRHAFADPYWPLSDAEGEALPW